MENESTPKEVIEDLFSQFIDAEDCPQILKRFKRLVKAVHIHAENPRDFYNELKTKLQSWKCKSLWDLLDARANQSEYGKGKISEELQVLVIGAGPIGLRTAIEIALLGGQVVVVEKRTSFSRNNVLHLWPFLLTDFRSLGAKRYYGKFCSGTIEHISIRKLQAILLKTALIFGVKVFTGVTFDRMIEPTTEDEGWKCKVSPNPHPVTQLEIDVVIGADGKKNVLPGFKQIEMRGTLAIGITANFINHNDEVEKNVEEISGIAYHFNPKFFDNLRDFKNIRLENIVYYKDETHYFVMTALKSSLLKRGVLQKDYANPSELLSAGNLNRENLEVFVKDVVEYATKGKLNQENLEYKVTSTGIKDVAVFDFTSIKKAENAARIIERKGSKLLVGLVGDSLLEPFWPTGSGCARGVLSALDAAWMIRSFSLDKPPLQILSERENIYKLLSNTDSGNLHKNYATYTINPNSRYMSISHKRVREVYHLYDTDDPVNADFSIGSPTEIHAGKGSRYKIISTHAKSPATAGQKKKTKLAMQLSMGEPAGRLRTSSASSVELLDEKPHKSGKKTRKLPPRGKQKELNVLSGESDIEGSKHKKKQKARKTVRESHEPKHEKAKRKSGKFLSRFGRSHKKKTDSENMSALANGNGHPAFEREISKQGKFKEVAGEVTKMDEGNYFQRKGSLKEREIIPTRSTKDIIAEMELRESTSKRSQQPHKPVSSIDWQKNGDVRTRASFKKAHHEETVETPPNKTGKRDKLIEDLTRLSPRAKLIVPVIKILSPAHKDNKEPENSLTSVARSAAMLAMATPLLGERLTQQQRPTSFTNKERQVLKSGLVRDVVSRYNSLNKEKRALRRTESSISDTPLKRPVDLKDGRPQSKVLSYSSSSESLKKDLLDMRSDAQKQRLEQSEKRDSEDSGFRSINEFDGDREQKALEDISNKGARLMRLSSKPTANENKTTESSISKFDRIKSSVFQKKLIAEEAENKKKEKENKNEKIVQPEPVVDIDKQCPPAPLESQEELDVPVLPSDPMASTLDSLVQSIGDRKTESSLKFMMELFSLIHQHPNEEKYRRIYKKRSKFKKLVWNNQGAKLFMAISGWMEVGSFILLPKSKSVQEPLKYLSSFLRILKQRNELNQTCPDIKKTLDGLEHQHTPPKKRAGFHKSLSTSYLTPGPSLLKENKPVSEKLQKENEAAPRGAENLVTATDRKSRLRKLRGTLSAPEKHDHETADNFAVVDRDERIRRLRLQLRAKGLTNSQRKKRKQDNTPSSNKAVVKESNNKEKEQSNEFILKETTTTADEAKTTLQSTILEPLVTGKTDQNSAKENFESIDSISPKDQNNQLPPKEVSSLGPDPFTSEQLVYDLFMDDPERDFVHDEEIVVGEETSTDSEVSYYQPGNALKPEETQKVKEKETLAVEANAVEIDSLSQTLDNLIESLETNKDCSKLEAEKRCITNKNESIENETEKRSVEDETTLLCDTLNQMLSDVDGSNVSSDKESDDALVNRTDSFSLSKGSLTTRQSAFRKPLRRHVQKPRPSRDSIKATTDSSETSDRAKNNNITDKPNTRKQSNSMKNPSKPDGRLVRKSNSSLSDSTDKENEIQVVQGRLPNGTIVELSRMTRVRKLSLGRQPIASNERAIDVEFKRPVNPPPLSKAQSLDRLSQKTSSFNSITVSTPDLPSHVDATCRKRLSTTESLKKRRTRNCSTSSSCSDSESSLIRGNGGRHLNRPPRSSTIKNKQNGGAGSSNDTGTRTLNSRPKTRRSSSSASDSSIKGRRVRSNSLDKEPNKNISLHKDDASQAKRVSSRPSRTSSSKSRASLSTRSSSTEDRQGFPRRTSSTGSRHGLPSRTNSTENRQGLVTRTSSAGSRQGLVTRTSSTGSEQGLATRTSSTGSQSSLPPRRSSLGGPDNRPPRSNSNRSLKGRASSSGSETGLKNARREQCQRKRASISQNNRLKSKESLTDNSSPKTRARSRNINQRPKMAARKGSDSSVGLSDPVSSRESETDNEVFVSDIKLPSKENRTELEAVETPEHNRNQSEAPKHVYNKSANSELQLKRQLSQENPLELVEQSKQQQNFTGNVPKYKRSDSSNSKNSLERKSSSESKKSQGSSSLTLQERKQMLMELAEAPPKIKSKPVNDRRSIMQIKNRSRGLLVRDKKDAFEKAGSKANKNPSLERKTGESKQLDKFDKTVGSPKRDKHRSFLGLGKKKNRKSVSEDEAMEEKGKLFEGSLVESPQNVSAENAFEFGSPGTYVRKSTISGTENVLNNLPVLSPPSDGTCFSSEDDLSPTSKKTKRKSFGLKIKTKKKSPKKSKH